MLCTTTVSPVRTKLISASSCGRLVSLPVALSVKVWATSMPSSCRSVFWSMVLTCIYPMRCPSICIVHIMSTSSLFPSARFVKEWSAFHTLERRERDTGIAPGLAAGTWRRQLPCHRLLCWCGHQRLRKEVDRLVVGRQQDAKLVEHVC